MGDTNGSGPLSWEQATEHFVAKSEFDRTVTALAKNVCDLKKSIDGLKRSVYVGTGAVVAVAFIIANSDSLRAFLG